METPKDPVVRNNIGFLLSQNGKLDEAIKWYNESIKIWDKYPNAYYNLAEALEKKANTRRRLLTLKNV